MAEEVQIGEIKSRLSLQTRAQRANRDAIELELKRVIDHLVDIADHGGYRAGMHVNLDMTTAIRAELAIMGLRTAIHATTQDLLFIGWEPWITSNK
jgi:hypothetical protein